VPRLYLAVAVDAYSSPVPLEGHWTRLETPLTRRERRLLVLLGCVIVLAAAGISAYSLAGGSDASEPGCVTATFAASLGGATVHRCGAAARQFCRTQGPRNARVAEACRRAGITTG
jgi:hypothetical protein